MFVRLLLVFKKVLLIKQELKSKFKKKKVCLIFMRGRNVLAGMLYAIGFMSVVFGAYEMFSAVSLTGYVVLGDLSASLKSVLGLSFFIGGLLVCMAGRGMQRKPLDWMTITDADRARFPDRPFPRVFVSGEAIDRLERDPEAQRLSGNYFSHILSLAQQLKVNPAVTGQTEVIGAFKVSPRGDAKHRVAWGYNTKANTLLIYDLLYHVSQGGYVDDWANRARKGEIGLTSYEPSRFSDLERARDVANRKRRES